MRIVFLLVLLAGIALGVVYPWAVSNFSGTEIGRFEVYDRAGGFRPAEATLSSSHAPVRVFVDMVSVGAVTLSGERTALTLTASREGRTVLASELTFAHQEPRPDSPQAAGIIYRDIAGEITPVQDGRYTFVVGPGDAEGIEIRSVAVVLRARALAMDERAPPIGYVLIAIGFVGFALTFGRKRPGNPNSQPPPPRWGRGPR
jgi:hypothetical protein